MSVDYPTTPPAGDRAGGGASSGSEIHDRAGRVGHAASESTKHVAATAADEAKGVAREARNQARELYDEARMELRDQAASQQTRAASNLRSVSDELRAMADQSTSDGMATQLVSTTASKAGDIADWLEQREPGDVLNEVKRFARRRPGVFIAVAAIAGVAVGRLTRGLVSGDADQPAGSDSAAPRGRENLGTAYERSVGGGKIPGTAAPAGAEYPAPTDYPGGTGPGAGASGAQP